MVFADSSSHAVSAGGASWKYGVTSNYDGYVYSYYYHSADKHGSSVKNSNGTVRSACVGKGKWSSAKKAATLTGNHSYWRYC